MFMDFETVLPFDSGLKPKVIDPCIHCGKATLMFLSGIPIGINRIPSDDGWACGECAGYECERCDLQIPLDEEYRVYFSNFGDDGDYINVHKCCATEDEQKKYEGVHDLN
jgi:hypothetical protein